MIHWLWFACYDSPIYTEQWKEICRSSVIGLCLYFRKLVFFRETCMHYCEYFVTGMGEWYVKHDSPLEQGHTRATEGPQNLATLIPEWSSESIATPLGFDASPSQGYPKQYVASTHLYTWVAKDNVKWSFLSKETTRWKGQGLKSPTFRSEVQHANHYLSSHWFTKWSQN